MTVYADLLFLINFSMDYLCLYVCARVLKRKMRLVRMLISASLGGIYSVAALFLSVPSPVELLFDALVCVIMCVIVFFECGRGIGSLFLCSFLYIGISMMSGGCMTALFNLLNKADLPLTGIDDDGISTYLFAILAAAAGIISLKSGDAISRRAPINECKLKVTFSGKETLLMGFSDSGNLVRDPISGTAVIFIKREKFSQIADLSVIDAFLAGNPSLDPDYKGIRMIPINTASGKSLSAAIKPKKITIELPDTSYEIDALISPTATNGNLGGYEAIVPAELITK